MNRHAQISDKFRSHLQKLGDMQKILGAVLIWHPGIVQACAQACLLQHSVN
jgi:hypothetical protein